MVCEDKMRGGDCRQAQPGSLVTAWQRRPPGQLNPSSRHGSSAPLPHPQAPRAVSKFGHTIGYPPLLGDSSFCPLLGVVVGFSSPPPLCSLCLKGRGVEHDSPQDDSPTRLPHLCSVTCQAWSFRPLLSRAHSIWES